MQALSHQSILVDSSRLSQPDYSGLEKFQTTRRHKNVSAPAKTLKSQE